MNCPNCGLPLESNDMFCGNCGTRITNNGPTEEYYPDPGFNPGGGNNGGGKNSKSSVLTFVLIALIAFLTILVALTVLSVTDFVSFENIPVLSEFEEFVRDIAGKDTPNEGKTESTTSANSNSDEKESTTTSPATSSEYIYRETETSSYSFEYDTTQAEQTTDFYTTSDYLSSIPQELSQYADGLVVANQYYKVTLKESDWNLLFRSSPQIKQKSDSGYNVIAKIPDGTSIYVSYIYDGKWIVYQHDGRWGFSAMYADNNPSQNRLVTPQ